MESIWIHETLRLFMKSDFCRMKLNEMLKCSTAQIFHPVERSLMGVYLITGAILFPLLLPIFWYYYTYYVNKDSRVEIPGNIRASEKSFSLFFRLSFKFMKYFKQHVTVFIYKLIWSCLFLFEQISQIIVYCLNDL